MNTILNFLLVSVIALASFVIYNKHNKGIHIINSGVSYLAGEACTINTPLSKDVQTIIKEAKACGEIHLTYQKGKVR